LSGRLVFSVDSTEFRWEDVILAASVWGDMERLRQQVREQIACLGRLDDEDLDGSPAAEAIARAADEFRYDRNLIAAEEMEHWLARWPLSAEEWMDYIRGSILRVQWAADLPALLAAFAASTDEVDAGVEVAGICSGLLPRIAHDLAGRAAVYESGAHATLDAAEAPWPFPVPPGAFAWPGLDPDVARSTIDRLVRVEQSYREFCRTRVTPQAIAARIGAARLDWTRLDCQSLAFAHESAAREAILCLTADGQRLDEVAADTGRPIRTESIWIESVDEAVQDRFLSAQPGDVIGPVPRANEFVVYRVRDRVAPSSDDEAIVDRARTSIVARLVEQAVSARVKWHLAF
jgi:hypothetical protein